MRGDDALLLHEPGKKAAPPTAASVVEREKVEDLAGSAAHRPINIRFLIGLIAAGALLSVGVWWLHSHQMRSMAAAMLEQSERARASGDLRRAAEHLQHYLQLVPDDHHVLARLALTLDEIAETPRERFDVLSLFEDLVRREHGTPEIRRRLVDLSMRFGRFGDAIEHLQALLRATPQDSELYLLLGRCHEGNRNAPQAAAEYESAIAFNPRAFEAYERLSDLLRGALERPADADQVLNRLISAAPESFEAYLPRARAHQAAGRTKDALLDARRAWQLAPSEPDVLVLVAELISSQSDVAEAQTYFQREDVRARVQAAVEDHPSELRLYLALANLELAGGRLEAAEAALRRGLQNDPEDANLRWLLADILIERQEYRQAEAQIAELRSRKAADPMLEYLEARVAMVRGDWLAARRGFEITRAGNTGDAAFKSAINLYLAHCYRELGQTGLEADAYRRALEHQPGSVEARVGRAAALVKLGRYEEAFVQYEPVKHLPPAAVAAARLAIERNLRRPPDERNWAGVEQLLDQAAREQSGQAEALVVRAEMLTARGDPEGARELLQTAVERQPGQVEFWVALADLESRTDRSSQAAALLDRAEQQLGRRVELYLARIQLAVRISDGAEEDGAEERLAELAERSHEFAGDEQPRIMRALAVAYEEIENIARALDYWTQAAGIEPNDLSLRMRILEVATRAGKVDIASSSLEHIRRIDGENGPSARLAEAAYCMLRARRGERELLSRARQVLQEADRASIGSPVQIQLAMAELCELEGGNEESAVEHYRRAIEAGERDPRIVSRAVQLLYERRRYFDAENLIKSYQEHNPESFTGGLGRMAAELSLRTRDKNRAIQLARQAVSETSADFRDHLWLGQLLAAAEQTREAEGSLRKARDLAPSRPEVWVALAHFYARSGRSEPIAELLDAVKANVPPELLSLTFAQCYEAAGATEQAAEAYEQVLRTNAEDPRSIWIVTSFHLRHGDLRRAEPLLQRLLSVPAEKADGLLVPARRAMAVVLASRGTYRAFLEALALLEQNAGRGGPVPEDLRVKARLLATRSERRHRNEAISILEVLDERSPLSPDEQQLLIELHLAADNWEPARRWLQALLAAQSHDPDVLAMAIGALIDNGEAEGAAPQWLEALRSLQPQELRTKQLQTRLLVAQGRTDEGLRLLQQHIQQATADPQKSLDQRVRLAGFLADLSLRQERLGHAASAESLAQEAERLMREAAEHDDEQRLVLARFLGRRWRCEDALQSCAEAWARLPAESVAAACVDVLRTGRPSPDQVQRVRSWIEDAAAQAPGSAELHFQLANVAHLQGDYLSAERLYRRTLELSPNSVVTQNELALLIALSGGAPAEAFGLINDAIESAGPLPFLLDTRATVCLAMGETEQAVKDLRQALADAPTAAKHFHLAQALLAGKDKAGAKTEFQKGVAAGLHARSLHPLERAAYDAFQAQIKKL